jgi:hypothetical protein
VFPLPLRLKRPTAADVSGRFEDVRQWIRALDDGSKARRGFGYEIQWEEREYRSLGRNRVPSAAIVPTREDALRLVHKKRDAERFAQIAEATAASCPELRAWLVRKPLVALEHAHEWEQFLTVVSWFRTHPRPGVYLRQVDIEGIDTKFIETHRPLLSELLSVALPADAIDGSTKQSFERRYGLLTKPQTVRFRLLDERHRIAGFSDLAVPVGEFAALRPGVERVFITENEVNALAFPEIPGALIIFGLGYAVDRLDDVHWLRDKTIHYWGDIDTHGFAMLDRLRARFPQASSLLMDHATLMEHQRLWVREETPHKGSLSRLTPSEREVFQALQGNRLGDHVRLEQERIRFGWATRAIARVT